MQMREENLWQQRRPRLCFESDRPTIAGSIRRIGKNLLQFVQNILLLTNIMSNCTTLFRAMDNVISPVTKHCSLTKKNFKLIFITKIKKIRVYKQYILRHGMIDRFENATNLMIKTYFEQLLTLTVKYIFVKMIDSDIL